MVLCPSRFCRVNHNQISSSPARKASASVTHSVEQPPRVRCGPCGRRGRVQPKTKVPQDQEEQETHLLSLQLKEQTEVVEQIPHLIKAEAVVERPLLEPMDLVVQDKAEQEQQHQ